ncbi:hypothetical protein HOLleu_22386 [Holothuria leucospilota]|uniref:Uncharacterized protein n=1 Tax=Holothuria leucospilota TaxID=206669 RepID=A0A9Q1BYZ3_HOLLE|nr:hypothetical protein HOLleu_22386 [Holothuria leucospilota]
MLNKLVTTENNERTSLPTVVMQFHANEGDSSPGTTTSGQEMVLAGAKERDEERGRDTRHTPQRSIEGNELGNVTIVVFSIYIRCNVL